MWAKVSKIGHSRSAEAVTGYRLPVTGYRLPVTGRRAPGAGRRLPVTGLGR
jgi:hypothetical protein